MSLISAADASNADEFVRAVFEDTEEITAGLARFGRDQVLAAVTRETETDVNGNTGVVLAFLRDAVGMDRDLRALYWESDLLQILRAGLTGPRHVLRIWAPATLGRLGPRQNIDHLVRAIPWYEANDPLGLPGLLSELGTSGRRRRLDRRARLTTLSRSRNYVARWVTVGILWEDEFSYGSPTYTRDCPGWALQLLRQLAQDRHPWVRADARRALREHSAQRHRHQNRADARTGWEPPRLNIERLERLVGGYLYYSGDMDYDAALVTAIAVEVEQSPIADPRELIQRLGPIP
jgi:hypothetical protein